MPLDTFVCVFVHIILSRLLRSHLTYHITPLHILLVLVISYILYINILNLNVQVNICEVLK